MTSITICAILYRLRKGEFMDKEKKEKKGLGAAIGSFLFADEEEGKGEVGTAAQTQAQPVVAPVVAPVAVGGVDAAVVAKYTEVLQKSVLSKQGIDTSVFPFIKTLKSLEGKVADEPTRYTVAVTSVEAFGVTFDKIIASCLACKDALAEEEKTFLSVSDKQVQEEVVSKEGNIKQIDTQIETKNQSIQAILKEIDALKEQRTALSGNIKMLRMYASIDLAPASSPAWRNLSYPMGLSELALAGNGFGAEGAVAFAAPTKADVTAPAVASKSVNGDTINFAAGSATLTDDTMIAIDTYVANTAKEFADARMRIEGHTSSEGGDGINKPLSRRRAEAVASYLVKKYHFNRNKFIVVGYGSSKPVADNGTPDGRKANRRTEFAVVAVTASN